MEKISIVRRRLEVSPTRAELRARQRMENPSPETLSGGSSVMTLSGQGEDQQEAADRPVSVDLGPQVMDELWAGGHLDETATGGRHFIVEAEKGREEVSFLFCTGCG